MNTQTIKIDYNINRMEPVDLISTIHIDDKNTRYLELTLLDHGSLLVLQGCTVKARFVATDKALLSDNVPCTVTADNTILVPIDAAAVQSMACDLRIEVNIVSGTDVLTLPFPLWVRVRGSILDNAPVTPDTEGTVAELIRRAEAELSRVQGFITENELAAALAAKADAAATLAGYGIVDAYDKAQVDKMMGLTPFTVCNLDLYDATLENADDNVILFLFGYDNNNSPTCGLNKLTEDDYGKVWHIVLTFTKADLVSINSVTVQEHRRGQPMPDTLQHYDNVAQGDVIRFDYTMSDSTASILRLRLNARAGEQKVHVLITSNRQLDDVLDTKANAADVNTALAAKANAADMNTALAAKADAADVDYKYGDTSEPVYVEPEALLVNNWVLNINGVPIVYNASATSVLIADVTGGETVKITARPFKTNYYYSFFDDNISFDSSVTNGGFTSDHLIGGARGTSTETHELFENVTVQVPANAKKIVVSVFGSAYTPRLYKVEYRRKRKWLGKKWCAVGDSITEVNGSASKKYLEYIAEQTGIEAVNMGKSGTGYKRKQDVNEAFYQRIGSVPTDSDVVTIFGSFNDAPYIFGDCLTQSTAPVTFPDTEEGAEAAAAEAARISWIPYKTINKHGEIVDVESTNPGGGKYAVTNAIPVRADRSYYIKTKMKYDRAFFVFKDGNGDNSSIVYVKRLNPANNDGTSYEFKGIIKAPENAKYLYVATAFYGESYNTFVKEDNVGTVNDTGTDTLAGCINTTIDNLYDVMPTVNLGIISSVPWGDYNPYTNAWANIYVDMLKEICQNRGIPFLDLYYESNLRPWEPAFRQAMYTRDNGHSTHPDENGHQLFAPRVEAFLDKLLQPFGKHFVG